MYSAEWPAASIAFRTSPIRDVTPVEVSLCTTHTALNSLALSARRRLVIASGSAPWRQSVLRNSTWRPSFTAIFCHRVAKWPVSAISTRSPGERVFTSAASQAPVPEAG